MKTRLNLPGICIPVNYLKTYEIHDRDMRVAILLPGHARTYKQTFSSFQKYLLEIYPDADIFMWSWDDLGYWTPDNPDGTVPEYGVYKSGKVDEEELVNLYKPKKYKIAKMDEHKATINTALQEVIEKRYPFVRPFNNVSCWYGVHQCDLLRRQYEAENNFQYDLVLRFRFDLELTRPFFFSDKFTFATDVWGEPCEQGYDDILFFGPSDTMTKICDLFSNIKEIAKEIVKWDSHSAFKYWVDKHTPDFNYRKFETRIVNTPGGYCKTNSLPNSS